MKRIFWNVLSVGLVAAGVVSCGKTTRGKMVNDWKVISSSQDYDLVDQSGGKYYSNETVTDNSVTLTFEYIAPDGSPPQKNSQTGTVSENTWSIKKDGTWVWNRTIELTSPNNSEKRIIEKSGTWGFVKKNKEEDFARNERVIFNVLSDKDKRIYTFPGSAPSETNSLDTYLTGELSMIFTVKESSNKLLEMEMDQSNLYSSANSTSQAKKETFSVRLR